jgi:uncharacterized DUF497 family protein
MDTRFEWDEVKADRNMRKHGVRFEDAVTVLEDPRSITIYDRDHSDDEDRLIDIGLASNGQVLVVVYTEREKCIRIISARSATAKERNRYDAQEK